jgi:transcriptional regulator with XRE-family HTH domain
MLLKEARMRKGLTQDELAERAQTTQAVISYLENGRRIPSSATRAKVEAALGLPVDWISTRLEGPIRDGFEENESDEDRVLKAIYVYIRTAQFRERAERFEFLRRLLDDYEKHLAAEAPPRRKRKR